MQCYKTRMSPELARAKARGQRTYFTGKPCRRGHIARRFVSGRTCVLCRVIRGKEYRSTEAAKKLRRKRERTLKVRNPTAYLRRLRSKRRSDKRRAKTKRRQAWSQAYRSTPTYLAKARAQGKREWRDPVKRARRENYARSPNGRDVMWRYDHSPKGIERSLRAIQSPKGQDRRWRGIHSPTKRAYDEHYRRTSPRYKLYLKTRRNDLRRLRRQEKLEAIYAEKPTQLNWDRLQNYYARSKDNAARVGAAL